MFPAAAPLGCSRVPPAAPADGGKGRGKSPQDPHAETLGTAVGPAGGMPAVAELPAAASAAGGIYDIGIGAAPTEGVEARGRVSERGEQLTAAIAPKAPVVAAAIGHARASTTAAATPPRIASSTATSSPGMNDEDYWQWCMSVFDHRTAAASGGMG